MYAALDVHGDVERDFARRSPVGAESGPQGNGFGRHTRWICRARRRSPGWVLGWGHSRTARTELSKSLTLLSWPSPLFQMSLSLVGLPWLLRIPVGAGMVWRHGLRQLGCVLLESSRVESRVCLPTARQLERVDCLRAAAGD